MALWTLLIILTVIVIAVSDHDVQDFKASKALAAEKAKSLSSDPGRGSLDQLTSMMNRTEDRKSRRRGKEAIKKIHQLNRHRHDDMLNDNEGALTTNLKVPDNDTLYDKMNYLRQGTAKLPGTIYEAKSMNDYVSQAAGVFCNFENETTVNHMCTWQWNMTVSSHGLGFRVVTAADVAKLNETTRGLRFTGPSSDADGNVGGEELMKCFRLFCDIALLIV